MMSQPIQNTQYIHLKKSFRAEVFITAMDKLLSDLQILAEVSNLFSCILDIQPVTEDEETEICWIRIHHLSMR